MKMDLHILKRLGARLFGSAHAKGVSYEGVVISTGIVTYSYSMSRGFWHWYSLVRKGRNLFHTPDVVCNSRFHRRRDANRLIDFGEVVEHRIGAQRRAGDSQSSCCERSLGV